MDTITSSPQPEQTPQTPNPTPSPKKKLSKKTLSFIGLLTIMLVVVGISIYVGYTQGQNETATNQVSDNTSDSQQNTEEDNQTDTQSEGDETETEYPIVTDLEVTTIPTPDDTHSNDYPIGEDWQEYYIEEIDTTVYHFGEEPVREFRPATNQEEYRITFDRDLTIWLTTIPTKPMSELGKRHGAPFNSVVDSIVNFNDYREESQDVEYILPVKDQEFDLVVSFDRPGVLFFEDMDLIQRYIFNIQNPGLIKYDPEIIYFVENNSEFPLFQGGVLLENSSGPFASIGSNNISKDLIIKPLVKNPFERSESYVLKSDDEVYFTFLNMDSPSGESLLYKYEIESRNLTQYSNLPMFTRLESVENRIISITMPCNNCIEGDVRNVSEGLIDLNNLTVTNLGHKEYQVTGYFQQEEVFAFEQNFTCDLLVLQEVSDNILIDESEGRQFDRNSEGYILLNLNYNFGEDQEKMEQIKNATIQNPVTLKLSERWVFYPQGVGPCFSMYLVEDVQE